MLITSEIKWKLTFPEIDDSWHKFVILKIIREQNVVLIS
jgi:hypothetical protein